MKLSIKKVWLVAVSFLCGFVTCALFVPQDPSQVQRPNPYWVQHVSASWPAPARPGWSIRFDLPPDLENKVRSGPASGGQRSLPWAEPRRLELIDMRPANELNTGK